MTEDDYLLRAMAPADHDRCAAIVSESFTSVAVAHGFPSAGIPLDIAQYLVREWAASAWVDSVVVVSNEGNGELSGVVFLERGDDVWAVGMVAVAVAHQSRGVGRGLVQHCIDAFHRAPTRPRSLRLTQDAFNTSSFALYLSLGFDPREALAIVSAPDGFDFATLLPEGFSSTDSAYKIRPAIRSDVDACDALFRKCNGMSRRTEIAAYVGDDSAESCRPHVVVDQQNAVVGYSTGFEYGGHTVAETEEVLRLLLGQAAQINRSKPMAMFFLCQRYPAILRWLTKRKLKISKIGSLMVLGDYVPPSLYYISSAAY